MEKPLDILEMLDTQEKVLEPVKETIRYLQLEI